MLSCQKDEKPFININQTELTIANTGGSQNIPFKSNTNWIATSSASWCTVTPAKGDASITKTTITLSANDTYDDRSCTVTIMAGSISKTITINQSKSLGLLVTKDKFDLTNDAHTIDVEVKANIDFDISKSDEWITQVNTRGLTTTNLKFDIAKNSSYNNRVGTITVKQKNGDLSSIIKVYQSQEDAIILSNKTETISSESQTLEVELKTNVDFEVIIPEEATGWVSYIPTRALRTETLMLNISENEDKDDSRTTDIYIKNIASNLQDTLTIIQEKAPDVPTITTLDVYDIIRTSAKTGGEISTDGGAAILAKGVCWSILENPTIEDSKTSNGLGIANFVAQIKNLDEGTTYYVRAYATNRAGTAYGNQVSFSTISVVEAPVISLKGGMYTSTQTVTITCATDGAQIRYTLDGSDPTETSELYNGAILIDEGVTLKAKAYRTNWIASTVAKESYIINLDAQLIIGSANAIQHIDASNDFIFRLDDLNDKDVFFVFSNQNSTSSRVMPQIVSNVATKNVVAKSIIGSQPTTFLIPGKPSITEFNNNPLNQPRDGAGRSQSQQSISIQSQQLMLGSQDYLKDDLNNSILSTVRKVISAHGKNLYVWVANNCWEQGGTKKYNVTQQMVDALASKFLAPGNDNDIYEWVTNIAGDHWGPTHHSNLIPETDDIHIWLMDIDNDNLTSGSVTLGYFYARDNFLKSSIPTSNEKLMFTVDAVLFAKPDYGAWDLSHYLPNRIISTLAHEFTHMIYFYQHQILRNQSSNAAINEMSAQCIEDLVANKIEADGPRGIPYGNSSAGYSGNDNGRLPLYNSNNQFNLLNWSNKNEERVLNYSKTYALGAYLMRNYGGANFIRELIQNNTTGVESIVAAVNANGGNGLSYGDILQRFGVANLLSDQTTMTTGYKFNTGSWITSTVNGIDYDLGSINLYNYALTPTIYNELPYSQQPNSNILYRAGNNLSGKNEWLIKGMESDVKMTVVIK